MPTKIPPQSQEHQPGKESALEPLAVHIREDYRGSGKLAGKKALISGGDSGIGRSVALHFAREGADVAFLYLEEHDDAQETVRLIEAEGRKALAIAGDVASSSVCKNAVEQVVREFGGLNILVNNAGIQVVSEDICSISDDEWQRHMDININGYFYLARSAVPHFSSGGAIINTSSINAFMGNKALLAYSTTKAAELGFTRALALELVSHGVRVNAVAPGPVWTPLQPASWGPIDPQTVADLTKSTPMQRCADPAELGPAYVYLASDDASFVTGQTLHVNGGIIVNG
ncbi:glucose 1-dehydrogenase [Neokomagataea anthophila]|uniref:Glucose 1-dehydrogenase n=1 Tax=Neokomagataea anthophila TaxID=2826925 RepID=A0ABS5E888_9PROT|nr:glucose 1-dehydrogenase [Neokomagataea anthophila]MBR0560120.1 glucose 1-dehydrogenase [Neokomagataea anthophila]